jgi:hypothetical protein
VLLRRYGGYIWNYGELSLQPPCVRELSRMKGVLLAARNARSSGWYACLGQDLLGFGVVAGVPYVALPDAIVPADRMSAELIRGPAAHTLVLTADEHGADARAYAYVPPPEPLIASIDPTFDETEEDRDFGLWLTHVLQDKSRVRVLTDACSDSGGD